MERLKPASDRLKMLLVIIGRVGAPEISHIYSLSYRLGHEVLGVSIVLENIFPTSFGIKLHQFRLWQVIALQAGFL